MSYLEKYLDSVVARWKVSVWIVETLFRVCIEPLYQLQQSLARTTHSPSLAGWNFQTIFRQLTFSSPPKWSQPAASQRPDKCKLFYSRGPIVFCPGVRRSFVHIPADWDNWDIGPHFSVLRLVAGGWWPCERCPCSVPPPLSIINIFCSGATCYSTINK